MFHIVSNTIFYAVSNTVFYGAFNAVFRSYLREHVDDGLWLLVARSLIDMPFPITWNICTAIVKTWTKIDIRRHLCMLIDLILTVDESLIIKFLILSNRGKVLLASLLSQKLSLLEMIFVY